MKPAAWSSLPSGLVEETVDLWGISENRSQLRKSPGDAGVGCLAKLTALWCPQGEPHDRFRYALLVWQKDLCIAAQPSTAHKDIPCRSLAD